MTYNAATFLEGLFRQPSTVTVDGSRSALSAVAKSAPDIGPEDLPPQWWELYKKRAAIREYRGGQAREHAEAEALGEIIAQMREAGEIS